MQHFFLLFLVLLEHGRPLVATTLSSPTSSTSTVSSSMLLGPPVSASTIRASSFSSSATSTTSPVMIVGLPVSASVSITGSTAEVTSFTRLIVSAVPTSTPSNATTLSKVTTNSSTTSKTLEVLVSSTPAATSATHSFSPTSTGTSSGPVSSTSLTPQTPSASSAGLTPRVKMGVGISAGILGIALTGVLICILVRFLTRRRMKKALELDEKTQTTKLQDFTSINTPGYDFLTPYPNGLEQETMPYFASALKPDHVKPAQMQELWTPGFVGATRYERDRISGRYELDTEGGLRDEAALFGVSVNADNFYQFFLRFASVNKLLLAIFAAMTTIILLSPSTSNTGGDLTTLGITPVPPLASTTTITLPPSTTVTQLTTVATTTVEVTAQASTQSASQSSLTSSSALSSSASRASSINESVPTSSSDTVASSSTSSVIDSTSASIRSSAHATSGASATITNAPPTASPSAPTEEPTANLSKAAKVGIGTSTGIAGMLIIAIILFLLIRRPNALGIKRLIRRVRLTTRTNRGVQQDTELPTVQPKPAEYAVPGIYAESLSGTTNADNGAAELAETLTRQWPDSSPRELPTTPSPDVPAASSQASESSAPGSLIPSLRATLNTPQDWKTGVHELGG